MTKKLWHSHYNWKHKTLTSGCCLGEGLLLWPVALAGAPVFGLCRTRLLQSVVCISYVVILIIIQFVVNWIVGKTYSGGCPSLQLGPWPSHGTWLSNFVHCRVSGTVYNEGVFGPAAFACDRTSALPCELSLHSCTMQSWSGLNPPMRGFLTPLCNASMLGSSLLDVARASPLPGKQSILSPPVQCEHVRVLGLRMGVSSPLLYNSRCKYSSTSSPWGGHVRAFGHRWDSFLGRSMRTCDLISFIAGFVQLMLMKACSGLRPSLRLGPWTSQGSTLWSPRQISIPKYDCDEHKL